MCKCGKHEVCREACREACTVYNSVNSIGIVCGIVGILMIGIGTQIVTSVDVTVGKIPFAWLVGVLLSVFGSAASLTVLTVVGSVHRWFFLVVTLLLTCSGVYNIIMNPRSAVICACPVGYYGSNSEGFLDACVPCLCGNGTCADTVYGDGTCTCPARYDTASGCTECVAGATGENCGRCKTGWKFESMESVSSCTKCYPGYVGEKCDYVASGVIEHTCDVGWKRECVAEPGLFPPWEGIPSDCSDDVPFLRTVVCSKCLPGFNGRMCTPCNGCDAHDPLAVCQVNGERVPLPLLSTIPCYDDYDCDSFQCVNNEVCAAQLRENTGCECKSPGYAGPLCEECTPHRPSVGSPCVRGSCLYNLVTESPFCFCESSYVSPAGICTKRVVDGECESGYWGPQCKPCKCVHGVCDDGKNGNGECKRCDYNEWIASGIGMWDGPLCNECAPGINLVGCGPQCLPTPWLQVFHGATGPRWDGSLCGEVQQCNRKISSPVGKPCDSQCVDTVVGHVCCSDDTCTDQRCYVKQDTNFERVDIDGTVTLANQSHFGCRNLNCADITGSGMQPTQSFLCDNPLPNLGSIECDGACSAADCCGLSTCHNVDGKGNAFYCDSLTNTGAVCGATCNTSVCCSTPIQT